MCLSEGLRLTQILPEVERWILKIIFQCTVCVLGVACSASPILKVGIVE